MRFIGSLACFIVALHSFGYAFGDLQQHLIEPGALWLYDVLGATWILNGLLILARGVA